LDELFENRVSVKRFQAYKTTVRDVALQDIQVKLGWSSPVGSGDEKKDNIESVNLSRVTQSGLIQGCNGECYEMFSTWKIRQGDKCVVQDALAFFNSPPLVRR
jgi:hypothetical protein